MIKSACVTGVALYATCGPPRFSLNCQSNVDLLFKYNGYVSPPLPYSVVMYNKGSCQSPIYNVRTPPLDWHYCIGCTCPIMRDTLTLQSVRFVEMQKIATCFKYS